MEGSLRATCCLKIGLQRITIVDLRCNKNVTPVKENQGSVLSFIGRRLLSGEWVSEIFFRGVVLLGGWFWEIF